jgi:hypothetical protein
MEKWTSSYHIFSLFLFDDIMQGIHGRGKEFISDTVSPVA